MREQPLWSRVWMVTLRKGSNGRRIRSIPAGQRRSSTNSSPSRSNADLSFVRNYEEVLVHPRLKEILAHKQSEVESLRKRGLPGAGEKNFFPVRDFKKAISRPDRIGLIAE